MTSSQVVKQKDMRLSISLSLPASLVRRINRLAMKQSSEANLVSRSEVVTQLLTKALL
jgi:metal-responsive CopG/Arc/MetJ family transcriptional regulator